MTLFDESLQKLQSRWHVGLRLGKLGFGIFSPPSKSRSGFFAEKLSKGQRGTQRATGRVGNPDLYVIGRCPFDAKL